MPIKETSPSRKDDGFRYELEPPKQLRKYFVPNPQPMPIFTRSSTVLRGTCLVTFL